MTYEQFTNMSTCCFICADKKKLRALQIHQTEKYLTCVNNVLVDGGVS